MVVDGSHPLSAECRIATQRSNAQQESARRQRQRRAHDPLHPLRLWLPRRSRSRCGLGGRALSSSTAGGTSTRRSSAARPRGSTPRGTTPPVHGTRSFSIIGLSVAATPVTFRDTTSHTESVPGDHSANLTEADAPPAKPTSRVAPVDSEAVTRRRSRWCWPAG